MWAKGDVTGLSRTLRGSRHSGSVALDLKSHKTHDCSDIAEVSVELRKRVATDVNNISKLLKKTEELLAHFETEKNDLINDIADVESESTQRHRDVATGGISVYIPPQKISPNRLFMG